MQDNHNAADRTPTVRVLGGRFPHRAIPFRPEDITVEVTRCGSAIEVRLDSTKAPDFWCSILVSE